MIKFKNSKCVQISKNEFEDIKFIQSISSCLADGVSNTMAYLIKDGIVNSDLPYYILKDMAYNLYNAVIHNYKYMKVVD